MRSSSWRRPGLGWWIPCCRPAGSFCGCDAPWCPGKVENYITVSKLISWPKLRGLRFHHTVDFAREEEKYAELAELDSAACSSPCSISSAISTLSTLYISRNSGQTIRLGPVVCKSTKCRMNSVIPLSTTSRKIWCNALGAPNLHLIGLVRPTDRPELGI